MSKQDHTFCRYEEGDDSPNALSEEIFQASWSHKCPVYVHRTPPCQGSCPAGEDIRGWLQIARGMEKPPTKDMPWEEYAFRRATVANPFPAVMGRVCPAPCQDGCNRNDVDDFVGINSVEQFIGDYAMQHGLAFQANEFTTNKRVAIIGGGVGGLACAYQLRLMGHACTVFDERAALGGMLRYGIPGYRTPREVIDQECQRIVDMGVEIKLNTRVGRDVSFEQLQMDFDAVVMAIGAQSGRALALPGGDAPNVVSGVAFLAAFNEGRLHHGGKKVVVIGGGDTAMDVVSVARRIGHIKGQPIEDRPENVISNQTAHDVASVASREGSEVMLVYRRPVQQMPAAEHEVDEAQREGVTVRGSLAPIEVVLDLDGRAKALRVIKVEWIDNKMHEITGSEFDIPCDLIVPAIGQTGDLTGLEAFDNGRGLIDADKHFQVPDQSGVFAIGDVVRPHLLTTAIGHAGIAAESIDRYLSQNLAKNMVPKRPKVDVHHFQLNEKLREQHLEPDVCESEVVTGTDTSDFAIHNFEDRARHEIIHTDRLFLGHFAQEDRQLRQAIEVSSEEVLGHFKERSVGLEKDRAVEEATRCMSCGMCFECDNCIIYCPQDAVKRTKGSQSTTGRYVYTDYSLCIGCHICAEVCPTGYIEMGMGE